MAISTMFGCAADNQLVAPSRTQEPDTPTISVVTLNLYHDKDDWPKREALIVAELRRLSPDVIALQEVLQHPGLPNQAESLARALGYRAYFISVDSPGAEKRYGNALLTRDPVLARAEHSLLPLENYRIAGMVRLQLHGYAVNIYVTHLHDAVEGGDIRSRQVSDLLAFIDASAGDAPSIVVGDFNSTVESTELRSLVARFASSYDAVHPDALRNPAANATLNIKYFPNDRRRIDHIFYPRDAFRPTQSRIIFDHPDADGTSATNHYGLLSTLSPSRDEMTSNP
ncbi:MAG: endonuclease/exonuclease/phosphatase family protein [Dokdonella sp.]